MGCSTSVIVGYSDSLIVVSSLVVIEAEAPKVGNPRSQKGTAPGLGKLVRFFAAESCLS